MCPPQLFISGTTKILDPILMDRASYALAFILSLHMNLKENPYLSDVVTVRLRLLETIDYFYHFFFNKKVSTGVGTPGSLYTPDGR